MRRWMLYISCGTALLAIWEYFGRTNQTARLLLSSPSLVLRYLLDNFGDLMLAAGTTLMEAVTGLLIATAISFAAMILCFYKPKLIDVFLPAMVTSQVIPLIVLAPFFILLFGVGVTSKIAMAAVISFFPIFVNFVRGYKSIGRNIHELMYTYDASINFKIRHVYFPLSASNIIAGLKISSTLSVIGAIVAEFTGAERGLGKNLFLSAIRLEPDMMMTSLILSSAIGGAIYLAIIAIERQTTSWERSDI